MKYHDLKSLVRQIRLDRLTLAIADQCDHGERCSMLAKTSAGERREIYLRSAQFAWRRATQLQVEKWELE